LPTRSARRSHDAGQRLTINLNPELTGGLGA
jgi:hypothetical protein